MMIRLLPLVILDLVHSQAPIGGVPGFGGFQPGFGGGQQQMGAVAPESCCRPAENLMWQNGNGANEDRQPWIEAECECLIDGETSTKTIAAGTYAHYHYIVDDYTKLDPRSEKQTLEAHMRDGGEYYDVEGRVTFHLQPCNGKSHLFVKPALLAEGREMDQVNIDYFLLGKPTIDHFVLFRCTRSTLKATPKQANTLLLGHFLTRAPVWRCKAPQQCVGV
jgi:hypothetical protein